MLIFLQQGLSFFLIGLLVAVRDVTVNVLEIPSGALADSFGRRRSMMVAFSAYIISFVAFALASATWGYFLAMFLFGIGESFRTGTHKAMIFEWLRLQGREHERTRVYGLTRSWSKIGSAVSGVIAAGFVLVTGTYANIFWFAIIPYAMNLINFTGYPRELDGDHAKATSLGESTSRMWGTIKKVVCRSSLRRLVTESMGWEGFFNASRDYLQPALQALALWWFVNLWPNNILNPSQQSAVLIGPVYAILFLLSAAASVRAHRLVNACGSETAAAKYLWQFNALILVALFVAAWLGWNWLLVITFVLLSVLQNIWRPILVSRIDAHSEAHEGATVLSVESQAQRFATLLMAPGLGWLVDLATQNTPDSPLWPIGLVGGVIAVFFVVRGRFV